MKLKRIFFSFTILTILTCAFGLYSYFNAQKTAAYNEDLVISISHTNSIKVSFSNMISRYQRITLSLSRHPSLVLVLKQRSLETMNNANHILDIFNASMQTSVCYLLDTNGITIASSNRNDTNSFIGKDYSFRPYFKNAVQGNPSTYMAQGITSGTRGIYFSNPVYDDKKSLIGVVVIKENIEAVEDDILGGHAPTHVDHEDFVFITDRNGVIFISDHPDAILHTLWKTDKKSIDQIKASKQFGNCPLPWLGFKKTGEKTVSDDSGKDYDIIRAKVKEIPGWEIIHLSDNDAISQRVLSSFFDAAGYFLLFLFALLFCVLLVLNFLAAKTRRALQKRIKHENVLATFSSNLAGIGIDSIDKAIDKSLSLLGNFTKVDRAYIFQFNKFVRTMDNTHEWCADGIEPQIQNLKGISVEEELPWFFEHIKKKEIFHVSDVGGLPKNAHLEKNHFHEQGIRSLIVLPIEKSGNLLGFIGFDSVRKSREWNDDEASLLRFFSQALGHVLDRKNAEQVLKENEQRYKRAQRIGKVGNWEYDIVTGTFWGSDLAKEMYGFSPDSDRFTTEEVEKCIPERERVHQALIDLIEKDASYNLEFDIHPISGPDTRTIRSIAEVQKDETGKPLKVIGVVHDITEQKKAFDEKEKLKAKLQQAQKMESIGQLAGGIAHDFNNILYPIMGFTQLSKDALPKDHPVQENLSDILVGTKRASDLVKRILLFSRQKEQKLEPIVLQPVIKESYKLLRATIPASIDLILDLYDGEDRVLCNESEIHEIILNLCTNSYHAIVDDYGTIVVGLKKKVPPASLDLPDDEYLCLSVKDNGVGIPEKVKNKIFEPYITTKDVGKGSGLGLSVVYGIVQNYKGGISFDSDLGSGTVFRLYLPITGQMQESDNTQKETRTVSSCNEHLLLVDDEEAILKLCVRVLRNSGYTVTAKNDSKQAFEFFKSNPDLFDLVITDMTMPGMVGSELASEILKIRPDIPVIICSGYNERLDNMQKDDIKISAYLDKPLSIENLKKTVRTVLDS